METQHVVVAGAGVVGSAIAVELLRAGLRVSLVDEGEPGGEQSASYGNPGWLSAHSVITPSTPGLVWKVPGYLADPLGPLSLRPGHLPKVAPWLLRYTLPGRTWAKAEPLSFAPRPLPQYAPGLHAYPAPQSLVPH